jgi:DNA polymerase III sliding clamp (beta) subunit (PCNA family)
MEISKKYNLEKAISTDPHRTQLHNIFITQRHAIATNGHILAIVPVKSEDTDTPGTLSVDALKLGRKVMPKSFDDIQITLDGKLVLQDGTELPRPEGEKPPRLYGILRDAHKNRKVRFGINVGLLKDLCDAIGTSEIILELNEPEKSILVRPLKDSNGETGLIMPMRILKEN